MVNEEETRRDVRVTVLRCCSLSLWSPTNTELQVEGPEISKFGCQCKVSHIRKKANPGRAGPPSRTFPVAARTANGKHNDKPMVVPNVTESFKQLLQLKEPDSNGSKDLVRDRSNFMAQMLTYCELVDISDFMNQSLDVTGKYNRWRMNLGDSAVGFLGDLRQHIRRLRMYSAGMAKASMRRLCEELGSVCIYAILAHLE